MFKIKTIEINEGGGREEMLDKLADSLHGEKLTECDYVVTIAKSPPGLGVTVRKKAVRKRKKS